MEKQRTLDEVGEFGLIDILTKNFNTTKSTIKGIGDDCAVLEYSADEYQLVTTDFLLEGIHFDLVYTPLKHFRYLCHEWDSETDNGLYCCVGKVFC